MAAFARDILNYKYYKRAEGGMQEVLDKICLEEKRKAPTKYALSWSALFGLFIALAFQDSILFLCQ